MLNLPLPPWNNITSIIIHMYCSNHAELGWNSLVPSSKYIFAKGSNIFKSEFIGFSAKSG